MLRWLSGKRVVGRGLLFSTLPPRPAARPPVIPSTSVVGSGGVVHSRDVEKAVRLLSRTVWILERGILRDFPPTNEGDRKVSTTDPWYTKLKITASPGYLVLNPNYPIHKDKDVAEFSIPDLRRRIQALQTLQHELTQPSPEHLFKAYKEVTSLHRGSSLLSPFVYVLIRRRILVGSSKWVYQQLSQTYQDQRDAWGLSLFDATRWADALVRISKYAEADLILGELKSKGYPLGLTGWAALIHSQTLRGEMGAASAALRSMALEKDKDNSPLAPDSFIYSYIIIGHLRLGNISAAEECCKEMLQIMDTTPQQSVQANRWAKPIVDIRPLNAILFEFVAMRRPETAIEIFNWMQDRQMHTSSRTHTVLLHLLRDLALEDEGGRARLRQYYRCFIRGKSNSTKENASQWELFHVRSIESFVAIWDAKGAWLSLARMIQFGWVPRARVPLLVLPLLLHSRCASSVNDRRAQVIVDWMLKWRPGSWRSAQAMLNTRGGTTSPQKALPGSKQVSTKEVTRGHEVDKGLLDERADGIQTLHAHHKASEGRLALEAWKELRSKGLVQVEETNHAQWAILACLKNMSQRMREEKGMKGEDREERGEEIMEWRRGMAEDCYLIWKEGVEANGQWSRKQVSVLLQIMRMSQMRDEIVEISRWTQEKGGVGLGPVEESWARRAIYQGSRRR